jgi:hypothetical protein
VPTISRFYGIVVYMNFNDHEPPHFHARYGESQSLIEIQSGAQVGSLRGRALQLVQEWRLLHQAGLMENWRRARQHLPLLPIPPLD